MEFQGRTGQFRQACQGTLDYDPNTKQYFIRIDDAMNPEFWLKIILPKKALEAAKAEALEEEEEN
jgi:hypothetical protein